MGIFDCLEKSRGDSKVAFKIVGMLKDTLS